MFSKGSGKNPWALFLLVLAGIVIGGFAGVYLGKFPYLTWLNYGMTFGLNPPFLFDFHILSFTFGLTIDFTIAGVIGVIIAVFLYKKI